MNSFGQNLVHTVGYCPEGITKVGLSKLLALYIKAQWVNSPYFPHCPAGNKNNYPSGEIDGLL